MKNISRMLIFPLIMCIVPIIHAQKQDLDKLLDLNIEELMNVEVISVSKTAQRLSEVPATVRVITAERIKERGYFTLEEALSDLPGFQFRNIVGFNSYVFMRGLFSQNQSVLLLVDGVQINELNSGGFYAGGQFNLSNVKKIEVVYGPASVLYGTNAISGIINIITNDPKDIQGIQVGVLTGNFNTRNYDLKAGYYNENTNLGFSISGMFKQTEKADLGGMKGDNNWTDDMENFEDDISLDGKMIFKDLSLGFVFQDKRASRTTNYKTIDSNYLDSGTKWHIRFINGHIKYVYDRSQTWSNQIQFYYRNSTVLDNTIAYIKTDASTTGGQTGYYRPNNLLGLENQLNLKPFKKLQIIAGLVLEKESLAEGFSKTHSGSSILPPPKPPRPNMMTNHLASVYLQAQYKMFKNTELTLGYRYDESSYYGTVNTPRIGMVYNKNRLTAKLLYMEAFRAPKPWDYTYEEGNPNLEPEIMKSVELGMAYTFTNNFLTNISFYKNHMKGTFTREERRQTNGPRLNTDGFEISFDYAKERIKWTLNYTYNFSRYELKETIPEIGKHNANWGVTYAFTNRIKLNLRGHYIGRRKNVKTVTATGNKYVDDALVFHSTLSVLNLMGFNIQLICKNLLDVEYYHTSNNPPERYRQPQRTIMFRLEYKIHHPAMSQ